jgi:hypothetical protein
MSRTSSASSLTIAGTRSGTISWASAVAVLLVLGGFDVDMVESFVVKDEIRKTF